MAATTVVKRTLGFGREHDFTAEMTIKTRGGDLVTTTGEANTAGGAALMAAIAMRSMSPLAKTGAAPSITYH
jgi:hypothetical protein